jgi:hypothetical protein
MKKVLLSIVLATTLFGDCSKLLKEAESDFKTANKKWDDNSVLASYYSIRGQQRYLVYFDCMSKQRHKEILKSLNNLKNKSNTPIQIIDASEIGTGY